MRRSLGLAAVLAKVALGQEGEVKTVSIKLD